MSTARLCAVSTCPISLPPHFQFPTLLPLLPSCSYDSGDASDGEGEAEDVDEEAAEYDGAHDAAAGPSAARVPSGQERLFAQTATAEKLRRDVATIAAQLDAVKNRVSQSLTMS